LPYNKVKGWHWESFWIVGGLFSWLIVPPIAAWLTIPHFGEIISQTSASTFGWTFFWGILWGIGGSLQEQNLHSWGDHLCMALPHWEMKAAIIQSLF
jgi:hypothetical protein